MWRAAWRTARQVHSLAPGRKSLGMARFRVCQSREYMRIYAYVKGGQFVPHLARRRLLAARANVKDEPRRAKTSADRAARQQLRDLAKQWRELAAMVENYEKTV